MKVYRTSDPMNWQDILKRPVQKQPEIARQVADILEAVRRRGDAAVREFTARYDGVTLESFELPEEEWQSQAEAVSEALRRAISRAAMNIRYFHQAQWQPEVLEVETSPGIVCWRRPVPIQRVGIYIPGGSAPLFSTVLMLAIPAQLAGCPQVLLFTPPAKGGQVHPAILYAARLAGVHRVFRIGGAQAIAAMAFGTETVPAVDKIFGPGNAFVTEAKSRVAAEGVAIDLPAGPSEVFIIADESADPALVAADLLSQAEHGADSQVILATPHADLVTQTLARLEAQLKQLPRESIARQALQHARALITRNLDEAMELANAYAPEHLILMVRQPGEWARKVVHAGSVFLGAHTPEVLGDYASGTNHVLPTGGAARAYSGVSVESFVRWITFQQASEAGLRSLGPDVEILAHAEQLDAHARAISLRLNTRKAEKTP
ncbi:MAG: histidinol dehydrogenase [Calditrichaeota bacterium]|nr:histidinol dehydrogenase [Calditrichota bacterium]